MDWQDWWDKIRARQRLKRLSHTSIFLKKLGKRRSAYFMMMILISYSEIQHLIASKSPQLSIWITGSSSLKWDHSLKVLRWNQILRILILIFWMTYLKLLSLMISQPCLALKLNKDNLSKINLSIWALNKSSVRSMETSKSALYLNFTDKSYMPAKCR